VADGKSFGHTVLERAKTKKEPESEKPPQQILPVDNAEDQIGNLLKRLEDNQSWRSDEERLRAEQVLKNPHLIADQINILKSGIFHEGELRGHAGHKTYPINDLEGFVAGVAVWILNIYDDDPSHEYDCLTELRLQFTSGYYDKLIAFLPKRFGISKVKKMEDIKNKFMALHDEIIPALTHDIRKALHTNVDSLFEFFQKHLPPHTPDQTIADRISDLLAKFDIQIKSGTILQRKRRAQK